MDGAAIRRATALAAAALPDATREEASGVAEFASGGERGVVLRVRWMEAEGEGAARAEIPLLGLPPDQWGMSRWEGERESLVLPLPEPVFEVRLPTVIWLGPGTPIPGSRLWRAIPASETTLERLRSLIAKGRDARRRQFRRCRFCGEMVPPEHRIDDSCCHGCATRHPGVVF